MRADRLFSIVLLLQQYGRLTAGELARRLEVTSRTILRDMEALSGAGVPIVADRGVKGGWSLLGEYRTELTGLNEAEVLSLFVTQPSRLLKDLQLGQAADRAMLKLLAALPSVHRRGAEHARQRIHVDPTGWRRTDEAAPLLQTIQEAVWQDRRLRITYERQGCGPVERTVDPLGLVAKGSAWYLVAAVSAEGDADDGREIRTYRVSRFSAAQVLDETCARPALFDLAEYWERSASEYRAQAPNYVLKARVRREIVPLLPYGGRFARVLEEGDETDGWITVRIGFDISDAARDYALGFGACLEVLEPVELRREVTDAARRLLDLYECHSRPSQTPMS